MRDEIAKAINEEQLITEAEGLVESIEKEELETEDEEKLLAVDFEQESRVLDDMVSAFAPEEEAPEEEALEEAFEEDYEYADTIQPSPSRTFMASRLPNEEQQSVNAMSERKSTTLRWIIRALILGGVIGLLVWYLSK